MAKALVTGGTGFVGSAIVRELLEHGEQVKCLVRPAADLRNLDGLDVERAEGDLLDRASLERALQGCDRLYHAAALYTLGDPPEQYWRANVLGTINMLGAALAAKVERVVYTSTVGAVGSAPAGGLADENTPWDFAELNIPYVTTKYIAEAEALRLFGRGLPVVIVNPTGPLGPRDIKPTPTGLTVVQFLRGNLKLAMDARNNFIDVDDLAAGHRLAMQHGRPGQRYILGGHNSSISELLVLLSEISGVPLPLGLIPYPLALAGGWLAYNLATRLLQVRQPASVGGVRFMRRTLHFDTTKAQTELGLHVRPLHETAQRAIEWYYEHGYAKPRKK